MLLAEGKLRMNVKILHIDFARICKKDVCRCRDMQKKDNLFIRICKKTYFRNEFVLDKMVDIYLDCHIKQCKNALLKNLQKWWIYLFLIQRVV